MTDSTLQRLNMVESQVRPSDVTDRRILKAMLALPRERFVPSDAVSMAYMDGPVALNPANAAASRYLLPPRTFAKLLQLADIDPEADVLDVACGTGYSTAILSSLAKRIVAVEQEKMLAEQARRLLDEFGIGNAIVVDGRLTAGVPAEAPFDVILINGAVETVPPALLAQLKEGGRLVTVAAEKVVCRAKVWQRVGSTFDVRPAFEAVAIILPGFEQPDGFVF